MKRCLQTVLMFLVMVVCSAQAWSADSGSAPPSGAPAMTPAGQIPTQPQAGSGGQEKGQPTGPDMVMLNFVNADIEGVVKTVSEITGKNFVLDPRVKGTINIISVKPMSRALVYEVFLSALRLQGYAAIEGRGLVRILPEADAKLHRSPTFGPKDASRPGGDQIQTRVFALTYESAAQVVPTLRPLIAPNNAISAIQNSNVLVITDYASNLQRIEKIIESIDRPAGTAEPVMIPLHYASAFDVAQTVNRLFADTAPAQQGQLGTEPTQRIIVVADARSNSLIARVGDPSRLAWIRQLAAKLDSPTSVAGNIHVVYLKNAEAVKLAEVLRAIYTGESLPGNNQHGGAPPAAQAQAQPQTATQAGIIQADEATNSIIITAPDPIYNNLRAVVEKLDARRAQVYVEALIAEVTADKAAEFGVQWQDLSGLGKSDTQVFGGTNFGTAGQNIIGITQNPLSAGQGLNIGVLRGTVTVGGVEILNLGLLVRALETDNNANILSTPTLLTLDNREAKIVIGQNVPFLTGQYALSGGATTPTPFQTIERKDVGLTLRIKPQISEGGTVRLDIFQEVSNVDKSSLTNTSGLTTNKRSVETSVLVNDGQIIVIGGLIQDSVSDGASKIPFFGDIPLIGGFFRYDNRSRTKTNLMVFLRPTVLRDAQRADALTSNRYDYIRGEQAEAVPGSRSSVLPNYSSPSLPPLESAAPAETVKPE